MKVDLTIYQFYCFIHLIMFNSLIYFIESSREITSIKNIFNIHTLNVEVKRQLNNQVKYCNIFSDQCKMINLNSNGPLVNIIIPYNHDMNIIKELKNGLLVTGGCDNSIKVWDPKNNYKSIKTLVGHKSCI